MSPTESIIGITALLMLAWVVAGVASKIQLWMQEQKRKRVIERFEK